MGFLHELHPGRESLAMDLIEEFRAPLVDRFVLNLINRGQIKGDDFERTPNGVVMRKDSRKTLMELWEKEKEINRLVNLLYSPKSASISTSSINVTIYKRRHRRVSPVELEAIGKKNVCNSNI